MMNNELKAEAKPMGQTSIPNSPSHLLCSPGVYVAIPSLSFPECIAMDEALSIALSGRFGSALPLYGGLCGVSTSGIDPDVT